MILFHLRKTSHSCTTCTHETIWLGNQTITEGDTDTERMNLKRKDDSRVSSQQKTVSKTHSDSERQSW